MTPQTILQTFIYSSVIFFVFVYSWIFQWILKKFDINVTYRQAFEIISLSTIASYFTYLIYVSLIPGDGLIQILPILTSIGILFSAILFLLFEKILNKNYVALLLSVIGGFSLVWIEEFIILILVLLILFAVTLFFVLQKIIPPFRYRKYLIFLLASLSIFVLMSFPGIYFVLLAPLMFFYFSSPVLTLGIVPSFFVFYYLTNRLTSLSLTKSMKIYLVTLIIPFLFSYFIIYSIDSFMGLFLLRMFY